MKCFRGLQTRWLLDLIHHQFHGSSADVRPDSPIRQNSADAIDAANRSGELFAFSRESEQPVAPILQPAYLAPVK